MRGRRCAGFVLCLLITSLATVPGAAANASNAQHTPDARQPASPVEIIVDGITPKAPGPKSTVEINGRVVNVSRKPLDGVDVRLQFSGSPLVTRSQLARYADGRAPVTTFPLLESRRQVAAKLPPKASATWRIRVKTADLGLARFGVYPLAIESLDDRERQVGTVRTFLPFVPERPLRPQPTRVAWLWPIVDRPHRVTDRVFRDDQLAKQLAPTGRLGQLVRTAARARTGGDAPFPLTYAIDPQVLEDAQVMSEGYPVRHGGETRTREKSSTAASWLGELRSLTDGAATFSLPYADPDMTALTHAGLDDNITFAVTKGETLSEDLLGRDVTRDVAWPPRGMLDQDTLDNLVVAGTRTVILADTALPPAQALTYTPDGLASVPSIGGSVRVLLADSAIALILGRDTWSPGAAVLTEQRFLAETALITAERPNQGRTLLVAPPRRWNPHPAFAAAVLADSAQVPWLEPTSLPDLVSSADPVPRSPLRYPPSARQHELSAKYLDKVQGMNRDVSRLTNIVTPRSSEFHLALLRTESSAWQRYRKFGEGFRRAVRDVLDTRLGRVRILSRTPLTLASTTGTMPVTIANDLQDYSVTVGLRVTPRNRGRLEIGEYEGKVTVGPERKETVQVPMRSRATGVTTIELQLVTPQGEPYGDVIALTVRATGYGTVALAITAGAFAVLFLAVGVRLVRRALSDDPEEDAEDDADEGSGEDTAGANDTASDKAGDTESADAAPGDSEAAATTMTDTTTDRTGDTTTDPMGSDGRR